MTSLSLHDARLNVAADQLRSGAIRLLSLDVFDTLLARTVPKPTDLFLRLGHKLQEQGQLGPGQSPDSFAAIRYQTEYKARSLQQRRHGNREVTLSEIYALVPSHISSASPTQLVEAEIATEFEVCFANHALIELAQFAKSHKIKLALISNTYLPEKVLLNLIQSKAAQLPELDGLFVSNTHHKGKRDGLMALMLQSMNVPGSQCLHIGDDPISDRETAANLGVPCIYLGPNDDEFTKHIAQEQPVQWHERTRYYADQNGDYGTTWLRRQFLNSIGPQGTVQEKELYHYGAQMVGPLLTGFMAWVQERAQQENASQVFGIAREGTFLNQLTSPHLCSAQFSTLATSRLTATLASFSPEYPEHLEDFLNRRGAWTIADLMQQCGFDRVQTKMLGDPDATLATISAKELTERIMTSPLAATLFENSAQRRQGLLNYLKKIGALQHAKLFLLDLGYAATIQRALQRIFTIEKLPITTHGFYLVSAHVSLETQIAGGIVEGFLAQNGNPNDFARAFCRSPEIIECACMPAYGSVIGYDAGGEPLLAKDSASVIQHQQVAVVQKGIKDYASEFYQHLLRLKVTAQFTAPGWCEQMRGLATRLVLYPSQYEAQLLGHWITDSDLGLASPRPIVSSALSKERLTSLTAAELIALPRRDIPWLYGVAATLSETLMRQVASLMLRQEEATTFQNNNIPISQMAVQGSDTFFAPFKPIAALSPARENQLQIECDSCFTNYAVQGHFDRIPWMKLLMQGPVAERRFVCSYLAQRFHEHGDQQFVVGLHKKMWRLGARDYENFKALRDHYTKPKPEHEVWTFLREAYFAAAATRDIGYIFDAVGFGHAMAYNAYNARIPYAGFQDCTSTAALSYLFTPLRPQLPSQEPISNRPLRLCYVLAGECGEDYSPITDIALAFAETHNPQQAEVAIVSMHPEKEVMSSRRIGDRLQKLRQRGVKLFFWPAPSEKNQQTNLETLVSELVAQRFDALIFATFTNQPVFLAAMRPAHLMIGIGLGDPDIYSSPLLDFTVEFCDFPFMDSNCTAYRIPDFMPQGRFQIPQKPQSKADLGVPNDALLIISSGRPIKFYDESYWHVVMAVLKQRPHVHIGIIGPTYASMEVWLKPFMDESLLPRIHFLGWRNDHLEVLAATDICLDTIPMGGGFNLTEAMNLGIPTVLCHNKVADFLDLYSNEKLLPIGEILCDPELSYDWDDVKGIERAVLRLIDDPAWRHSLKDKLRQTAQRRTDVQRTTAIVEDLIRKHSHSI